MKFYEVNEPYYALVKGETKEEAIKNYIKFVAEDDGNLEKEIREVNRDYAFVKFDNSVIEDGDKLSPAETMREFNDDQNKVLVIDGDLI